MSDIGFAGLLGSSRNARSDFLSPRSRLPSRPFADIHRAGSRGELTGPERDRLRLEQFAAGGFGEEVFGGEGRRSRQAFEQFGRFRGSLLGDAGGIIQGFRQNPFAVSAARQVEGLRGDVLAQLSQFRERSTAALDRLRGEVLTQAGVAGAQAGAGAAQIARLQGGGQGLSAQLAQRAATQAALGQSQAFSAALGNLGAQRVGAEQVALQSGIQGLLGAGQIAGTTLAQLSGQEGQLSSTLLAALGALGNQAFQTAFRPGASGTAAQNFALHARGAGDILSAVASIGSAGGVTSLF